MFNWLKGLFRQNKKHRRKSAIKQNARTYTYWKGEKYLFRKHRTTGVVEKLVYENWVRHDDGSEAPLPGPSKPEPNLPWLSPPS